MFLNLVGSGYRVSRVGRVNRRRIVIWEEMST